MPTMLVRSLWLVGCLLLATTPALADDAMGAEEGTAPPKIEGEEPVDDKPLVEEASMEELVTEPAVYMGLYGGAHVPLDDWDLHETENYGEAPALSPTFGIRFGGRALSWLNIEFGVAMIPFRSEDDEPNMALAVSAEALLAPFAVRWAPYLAVGGGIYHNSTGTFGKDTDPRIQYGLGLRFTANKTWGVRADVRHIFTDGYESDGNAFNFEGTVGFELYLWRYGDAANVDSDRDGIPDDEDACPKIAGDRSARGCPDGDGDGVWDDIDECPMKPGPERFKGCPDSDGDGLPDRIDDCPKQPGPPERKGCPLETDNDDDGVLDSIDKCPGEAGPADNDGCPVDAPPPKDIEDRFSGTLEGINFRQNSSKIRSESLPILDDVARVLRQYPRLKIRIEGHTDSVGRKSYNLRLSKNRAASVREYLISKGVEGRRITSEGYGEERPIAPNTTKQGRAKNRRTEIHITER